MRSTRPVQLAVFLGIIALYVAARLWRLTDSCLWFDEIFSVHAAEHPWDTILPFVSLDLIHPPLFYILLKIWISVGGEGVLWLRVLPVIFSVIAIYPFLALSRELKISYWPQLLGLFLIAVNGSLIKYAQEVRMYSLMMCLALFSMWLFARFINRSQGIVVLTVVNVSLVYTHYFGWFVVLAEIVAVLLLHKGRWRTIIASAAVTSACFLPWVIAVYQASLAGSVVSQNIGWISRPGPRELAVFLFDLVEPFYFQSTSSEPASIYRVAIPILVIVVAVFILALSRWELLDRKETQSLTLLAVLGLLPVMTVLVVSWLLPYSIWGTRHLIAVFAPMALVFAVSVYRISSPVIKTASITFLILFSAYGLALQVSRHEPRFSWCAWGPLSEKIETSPRKIYVFEDLVGYHLWREFAGRTSVTITKIQNMEGVTEDPAYFLPRGFDQISTVAFSEVDGESFWIAHRAGSINESEPPLRNFLVKGYRITRRETVEAQGEIAAILLLEK